MFLIAKIPFRICMTCYRQKFNVWLGKSILSKRNPQNTENHGQLFGYADLEGAGGQTDDTRSTFRVPMKTLGYNGSN